MEFGKVLKATNYGITYRFFVKILLILYIIIYNIFLYVIYMK